MVLKFIILWFLFWKFFKIFVQCATWFEFAMSVLAPFLFGKILISNKLYQLYWNIISVQIFGILSLSKMWILSQLGIILKMILSKFWVISICTSWNTLVWVQKSLIFLFCATWFISHVGSNTELFFTILLFFRKTKSHDKKSQSSDNFELKIKIYSCSNKLR